MSWTESRIKTLTDLWTKGKSASEIAKVLGNVSRNAVIGKANRLGLSGRPSPIKNLSTTPKEKSPKKAVVVTKTTGSSTVSNTAPASKALSSTGGASIFALNDRMCKWPEGDPREPGFHFCGKASHPGLPYCREHAAQAYQPARRREDERKNNAA